jgi:DNA adenine methylase
MEQTVTVKPVLRWAGGKSWFVRNFRVPLSRLEFDNYHEPFLGGASAFLTFGHGHQSYLSDLNPDLIETYQAIKKNPNLFFSICKSIRITKSPTMKFVLLSRVVFTLDQLDLYI